jgi:hypothetical protein
MSQMRFLYENIFDLATLAPSSELRLNPAENTQTEILSKTWRTESGFVIRPDYNDKLGFKATATGSVLLATVASGTYTGSGLASAIQAAMRVGTVYELECTYDTSDSKFRFDVGATATALSLHSDYATSTVMTIIGFDKDTDYTGATGYTSTSTVGNQSWLTADLGDGGTSSYFVIDGFNMTSGTVLTLRLADQTSTFSGLYGGTMSASSAVTLSGTRTVFALPADFTGTGLQISWYDPAHAYSEVGRLWLGDDFYPANHPDNNIHWMKKVIQRRSNKTEVYSGATYFDTRDPVIQWTIIPEALNEYYNPLVKTGFETMFEAVGDNACLYVVLESDTSNTIYGFIVGNTLYNRERNTPIIVVPSIVIQEQK